MFLWLYPNKINARLVPHMIMFAVIYDVGICSDPEIIYQPTIVVIPNNITPSAINPLVIILFSENSIGLTTLLLDQSEYLSNLFMILFCNESI